MAPTSCERQLVRQRVTACEARKRTMLSTSSRTSAGGEDLKQHFVWEFSHHALLKWPRLRTGPFLGLCVKTIGNEVCDTQSIP